MVGAGYAGMWTAWHLKALEPDCRVVVLEAGRAGFGPSGRNGGFCNSFWFSLPVLRRGLGDAAALELAREGDRSVEAIGEFCSSQGIDAWYRRDGYLRASAAEAQDDSVSEAAAAARAVGADDAVRELSAAEVAKRCRSPLLRDGVLYPGGATVQPARLAFGLAGAVSGAGVELFEGTPVRRLRTPRGGGVEARTPGGTVHAPAAVVAVGAAATGGGWRTRGRLTVASSHMAITEPVPELLEEVGWTGGEGITDCGALLHYFRTTPDGRIAFGWGGGRIGFGARLGGRMEVDRDVAGRTVADLRRFFPDLEGRRIEHAWGGPIDATPTHVPLIHVRASGRVATAFGFTGHGVGASHLVGRSLASLALGRGDAASRLPLIDPAPRRVPPEPFRWIGGNLIRAGLDRTERAELEGRRAGPVSRALAALPGRIGFHIGR